jgi:tRNA-dihydrouridine synthase
MRDYGVDAVLIGRGALRNPFIFEQAFKLWKGETYSSPQARRYVDLMSDQKKMLNEIYQPKTAMIHARKFLAWYSAGFPGCHEFRSRVFKIDEPDTLWSEAESFFEKSARERDMKFLSQPFLMGGHG